MFDLDTIALNLARASQDAASLLYDAICNGCRTCAAQISDLNRQAALDLSDAERHRLSSHDVPPAILPALIGLCECVSRAFSAALLLHELPTPLPPLCDVVACNLQLADYAEQLLTAPDEVSPYAFHLAANKGRGAHALLLTNYCNTERSRRWIPLFFALETHRNTLEHTCSLLTCVAHQ